MRSAARLMFVTMKPTRGRGATGALLTAAEDRAPGVSVRAREVRRKGWAELSPSPYGRLASGCPMDIEPEIEWRVDFSRSLQLLSEVDAGDLAAQTLRKAR
jgi:hypothetical protein